MINGQWLCRVHGVETLILIVNCHAGYMVRTAPIRVICEICVRITRHNTKKGRTRGSPLRGVPMAEC